MKYLKGCLDAERDFSQKVQRMCEQQKRDSLFLRRRRLAILAVTTEEIRQHHDFQRRGRTLRANAAMYTFLSAYIAVPESAIPLNATEEWITVGTKGVRDILRTYNFKVPSVAAARILQEKKDRQVAEAIQVAPTQDSDGAEDDSDGLGSADLHGYDESDDSRSESSRGSVYTPGREDDSDDGGEGGPDSVTPSSGSSAPAPLSRNPTKPGRSVPMHHTGPGACTGAGSDVEKVGYSKAIDSYVDDPAMLWHYFAWCVQICTNF